MGYNVYLRNNDLTQDHTCPICLMILENPVKSRKCHHIFCRPCIDVWLSRSEECPYCRSPMFPTHLGSLRPLRNRISNLEVFCQFHDQGCQQFVKLRHFEAHKAVCDFNPVNIPRPCDYDCGAQLRPREIQYHNCISYLRTMIEAGSNQRADLISQLEDLKRAFDRNQAIIATLQKSDEEKNRLIRKRDHEIDQLKKDCRTLRIHAAQAYAAALSQSRPLIPPPPPCGQRSSKRFKGSHTATSN